MASPVTLRLDKAIRRRIANVARQKKISPSRVMREAIEAGIREHERALTPYELVADLIGSVDTGDSTLSENIGRKVAKMLQDRHYGRVR